ncbi:MAG: RNA polymerase sigma-70 factor (ECF subfamily) [Planctomycetota bacterium]|jgi:RNA polymerase sigma-70 factor (ECF subfamily)
MPEQTSNDSATPPGSNLRELVQRHQTGTWRYLRALGAPPQLAEELLQDTFVVAWQRGLSDQGDAPVATFLRRTARHLYLKHCRAQGRRDELLADAVDHLWQRTCADDQGERWLVALRDCTDQLEGRAKAAVHLCYGPDAARGDRDKAAESLGIKSNGLKTLLQRARAVLRECIENKLEEKR